MTNRDLVLDKYASAHLLAQKHVCTPQISFSNYCFGISVISENLCGVHSLKIMHSPNSTQSYNLYVAIIFLIGSNWLLVL